MVENQAMDEFILANLPATFQRLHLRGTDHFNADVFRKIDQRLQSLRKRGLIKFDRLKGEGVVWSKVA